MFSENATKRKFVLIHRPCCFLLCCEVNNEANTPNMEDNMCSMTINADSLLNIEDYETSQQ